MGKIIGIDCDDTLQEFMYDYGMDVVTNRAIPTLVDGLKPVARRILYDMHKMGISSTSPHKKVMTVVGDVMGKFHPHGDSGITTALVNMGADYKTTCLPIDGHGNFGSVDTEAAAPRYIECRLSKFAEQVLLKDLTDKTVPYTPNFSDEYLEPTVLPVSLPNILLFPNVGIALGYTCSYLPHNPRDVINLCISYVKDRTITQDKMCEILGAPDFPNGGEIHGIQSIHKAYKTGKGYAIVRGTYETDIIDGYPAVIITSLPYGMPKYVVKKKQDDKKSDSKKKKEETGALNIIDDLINGGLINVKYVGDESDKTHPVRIVVQLKKDEDPERVVKLFIAKGVLQSTLGMNHFCLFNNKKPGMATIGQIMSEFISFRETVLHNKFLEELDAKNNSIMILEGLFKVSNDLDKAISMIRKSKDDYDILRDKLMKAFDLNKVQADYILAMQLRRLSGLEIAKYQEQMKKLKERVKVLLKLTKSKSNEDVDAYMIDEWQDLLKDLFKDKKYDRRTKVIETYHKVHADSTIKDEPCSIIRSSMGYLKRVAPLGDKVKGRGTNGTDVSTGAEDDAIAEILNTTTVDDVYAITSRGRIYRILANAIPQVSNKARGTLTRNLFKINDNENVVRMFTSNDIDKFDILTIVTESGIIKSIELDDVLEVNSSGKKLINVSNHDKVVASLPAKKDDNILIASKDGQALYTSLTNIRISSRGSGGVKTIKLADKDIVVSAVIAKNDDQIIVISTNGFVKRIKSSEFNTKGRTGQGVSISPKDDEYGDIADVCLAQEVLTILTAQGKCLSIKTDDIRLCSRASKGVKSINLFDGDVVKTIV